MQLSNAQTSKNNYRNRPRSSNIIIVELFIFMSQKFASLINFLCAVNIAVFRNKVPCNKELNIPPADTWIVCSHVRSEVPRVEKEKGLSPLYRSLCFSLSFSFVHLVHSISIFTRVNNNAICRLYNLRFLERNPPYSSDRKENRGKKEREDSPDDEIPWDRPRSFNKKIRE